MRLGFAALACFAYSISGAQIVLGQIDTFSDGTAMGWGSAAAPTPMPDGGPLGSGDAYLQITSGVAGTAPHLAVYCYQQWSGNYQSAGVRVVEVDLRNQGAVPLSIRAVLHGFDGTRLTSTAAVVVPADNLWRHAVFPLAQSFMTRVYGSGTFASVFSGVDKFQFRHDPGGPSAGGENVQGQLGLDNIAALPYSTTRSSSFSYQRGQTISGALTDTWNSDDFRLVSRPSVVFATTEAPIRIEFSGTTPFTPVSELTFHLESSASASTLLQKTYLYNFATLAYDQFDSFTSSVSDESRDVVVSSGTTNYVDPATRQMKALVTFKATAPVFSYPWLSKIDHVAWRLTP